MILTGAVEFAVTFCWCLWMRLCYLAPRMPQRQIQIPKIGRWESVNAICPTLLRLMWVLFIIIATRVIDIHISQSQEIYFFYPHAQKWLLTLRRCGLVVWVIVSILFSRTGGGRSITTFEMIRKSPIHLGSSVIIVNTSLILLAQLFRPHRYTVSK